MEIGGRLPTATQLHQAFVKILSKHLASNKKVNFVFQQQSSNLPLMNPSPTEIVELFSFVETTLIQYATVAGHFPSATAASVKAKPKKAQVIRLRYLLKKQRARLRQMPPGRLRPGQKPRFNLRAPCNPHHRRQNRSPRNRIRVAKALVRVSEDVLSLDLRSVNSSVSISSEEHVNGETNASMSIR